MKRILPPYALALLFLAACGKQPGDDGSLVSGGAGSTGSSPDSGVDDPGHDPRDPLILTEDFPPPEEPTDPCAGADAGCDELPTADAGPACGDGILDVSEACDDGNGTPGDGCSGSCQMEPNFTCSDPGTLCVSSIRCGDGVRVGAELCDDGDTISGNGCSAACDQVEGSYSCPPNGGPCATNVVCGDGRITGNELCDDGNNVDGAGAGDGCSANCLTVVAGYSCSRPGQPCVQPVVCGDGRVSQGEQCDEGTFSDGVGCTTGCFREADYACDVAGQACVSLVVCGDGILLGNEVCDDGNLTPGDGCSATCTLEAGWTCPVVDSNCEAADCGDGVIAGDEECEDGDVTPTDGDGCDSECRRETGFGCVNAATSPPSTCQASVCGLRGQEGDEACDDGNNIVGDGCNPFCQVEPICGATGCESSCGDGIRLPADADEECDDGNTLPGDGCSDLCEIEDGFACTVVQGTLPAVLNLPVTFRDLISFPRNGSTQHPDFETFGGSGTAGLVQSVIGADKKPVYTGICEASLTGTCPNGQETTSALDFHQWYNDNPLVNRKYVTTLSMNKTTPTSDVYQFPATLNTTQLFPLDDLTDLNASWVTQGSENENSGHNFGFTSEIRHWFEFKGGERLTFSGDDDVWVFINGKLALDLGGLHSRQERTIVLDAGGEADCTVTALGVDATPATPCAVATRDLDLVVGNVYEVSLFHAERHTGQSNFDLTLGGFVSKKDVCAPVCGDGVRTPDENCDDGVNLGAYGSCTALCERGPHCGDGITQASEGEACDTISNQAAYGESGCARGCRLPSRCGDGQVDGANGETCDDGVNDGSYGSCTPSCQLGPRCGDGTPQASEGEECDDGLNDGSYGNCAPGCLLGPRCGDGQTQALQSEQCDDGQNSGEYGECQSTCQLGPRCGDGVVQASEGEQCDDSLNNGGYGECQSSCVLGPRCGDGVTQASEGEQCDDSLNNGGYGECFAGCRLGARCGDGVLQTSAGETCDDGNRTNSDGCNSVCRVESGIIY